MATTIAFIVNGSFESAMGHRARSLAMQLQERYDIRIAYREGHKSRSIIKFLILLAQLRPTVSYIFDMSYSGVLAAWVYRILFRNCLIVDTGDVIYELVQSTGSRGRLGLWLTKWFEKFSLRIADGLIVRGRFHQQWLAARGITAEVVQDGVDTRQFAQFRDKNFEHLRTQYGLDGVLTIGLIGSSIWSEKLGMCYGWELVETLRLLKDAPVKGVFIGDGSGIPHLKSSCQEYGIEDKVLFLGYVPYDKLPGHLQLIDICLSTQTNNLVGQVRTTGKLPLYLAAGRYILASEVGEAAFVLGKEMLIDYEGVKDHLYPQKLAQKVQSILQQPEVLDCAANNIALAEKYFDYSVLAERLGTFIETTMNARRKRSWRYGQYGKDSAN